MEMYRATDHKRLYGVWASMKNRCYDKSHQNYDHYGGRGIGVCDEWLSEFKPFAKWALTNGYNETAGYGECTLDRIDVNGNYEPSNCRFISLNEQNKNRRNNVWIELNGEKVLLLDVCKRLNLDYNRVYHRIRSGWSVEDAVNIPIQKQYSNTYRRQQKEEQAWKG